MRPFPLPIWTAADRKRLSEKLRQHVREKGSAGGYPLWTVAEEKIIKRWRGNYPEMERRLPRRTRNAIETRAQLLGLVRKQGAHVPWTGQDLKRLRVEFVTARHAEDLLDRFPGRTLKAIYHRAHKTKLKRRTWTYKSARHSLINVVRDRCRPLGYTMRDLDELAGTGRYFPSRAWAKCRQPSPKAISQAVKALGGKLRVEWID